MIVNKSKSIFNIYSSKLFSVCTIKTSSHLMAIKPAKKTYSKGEVFGKWFSFLAPCLGVALGTWQYQRKQWKRDLIQNIKTRTCKSPIPLPENLSELNDLEFGTFLLEGTYDHSKEIFVGPRSLVEASSTNSKAYESSGLLSTKNKSVGYHVITPFKLKDRDLTVLINRGYVEKSQKNACDRIKGQVEGLVSQVGILRKSERKPFMALKNDPVENSWYYKDVDEMASFVGCDSILLDANIESTIIGGPIGGQTRIELRDEHFSYMVTWYALAVWTFIIWFKRYYKFV